MPLDPALNVVLEQISQSGVSLHDLTPEVARTYYDQLALPTVEVPLAKVEERVAPGPEEPIRVRIYRPEDRPGLPVLVYFHGGGWVIGSLDSHDPTCRELAAAAGCAVASVDYRLAPEHRYPAAAEDGYAAVRWIAESADELRLDPQRIAVGGDSAGGNLAAAAALMARDRGGPRLCFQLLVYPVLDADFDTPSYRENERGYLLEKATMEWFWDHYVPDRARRREAYCAPLRAESLSDLPPALVISAEYDPLRDEGEAYARRLADAGVAATCTRYDGMIHGFFSMGAVTAVAGESVRQAAAALRRALA